MFKSKINKDSWYAKMLIYLSRIVRRKVNGERKGGRKGERKKERKKGRKEDIERSKVADSDDEHKAAFQ
jgi:hypothetical protein